MSNFANNKDSTDQNIVDDGLQVQIPIPQLTRVRSKRQQAIQQFIRSKNRQAICKTSKIDSLFIQRFASAFKKIKEKNHCSICEEDFQIDKNISIADCEHRNTFCQSCLHQYAIYRIQQFNKVLCPNSGCNMQMDIQGQFFKSLPAQIQLKYGKIYRFYLTLEDPTLKMCLRENCEGIISINLEVKMMRCNVCHSEFCTKCQLLYHEEGCEQFQQQFFEKTLHYRRCSHCRAIIQKFQGCNHMTCICRYQFCYVCGADWTPQHYRNHDQNGVFIPPPMYPPLPPRNEIINVPRENVQPIQNNEESSRKKRFILTLIPRVIIALILFILIIALFGLVITAAICAICTRRVKSKNRPVLSQSDITINRQIDECISNMCGSYFSLYQKVVETFLKY